MEEVTYLAYEKYRPSKIEWVRSIPAHWNESAVKINYLMQLGKMLQNDASALSDVEVSYLKAQHVNWNRVTTDGLPKMWASPSELKNYGVQNGDLLVCEGGEVGRAAILEGLDEPAIIQNAIHRIRGTASGDIRFFSYLLKNIADAGWFAILCNKATIAHLTVDKLGAIQIPIPSLAEQQKIAAFLDWKTSQIDALIAKKQTLLQKLKEKRLAVITQAVTKGLNPDAPMRNSGSAWLGAVPTHWDVKPVKYLTRIVRGQFSHRPRNDPAFYDGEYPFVQTGDIARAGKFVTSYSQTLNELGLSVSRQFPARTLVMTIAANIGDMAIIDFAACFPDSIVGFIPEEEVDLDFLYFMFIAMKQRLMMTAVLNTQLNLNIDRIASIETVAPPHNEQIRIVALLDEEVRRSDLLMEKAQSAITCLTAYRSALITAATTGKIDVRNVAIPAAA